MSARKILHKCIDCGKERLVELKVKENKPHNLRCWTCAAKIKAANFELVPQHGKCIQCDNDIISWRGMKPKYYCSRKCNSRYRRLHIPLNARVKRLSKDYKAVIGEIRTGTELQLISDKQLSAAQYIWRACEVCGDCVWVEINIKTGEPISKRCILHRMPQRERHHNWKGGRRLDAQGYIHILLSNDDFYLSMAPECGEVLEHRLVMARHLGRCLAPFETVHHKNGNKSDNRIENLELTMNGAHHIQHHKGYKDGYAKGLMDGRTKQVEELKEQNKELLRHVKLLEWHMKETKVI